MVDFLNELEYSGHERAELPMPFDAMSARPDFTLSLTPKSVSEGLGGPTKRIVPGTLPTRPAGGRHRINFQLSSFASPYY